MIHILKTWKRYFAAVVDGSKTFDARRNDRGFAVGDTLRLVEVNEEMGQAAPAWGGVHDLYFTGRSVDVVVTYLMDDVRFVQPGFVVMAIRPKRGDEP